jgi:hypothetical protein
MNHQKIVLDQPNYFVVSAFTAFLFSFIILYLYGRFWRRYARNQVRGAALVERSLYKRLPGFYAFIVGALIVFFVYKFYTAFVAVEMLPDRILLAFPWPRPAVTLLKK